MKQMQTKLFHVVALSRAQKNAGGSCCSEQPAHSSVVAFSCIQQGVWEKPVGGEVGGGLGLMFHTERPVS